MIRPVFYKSFRSRNFNQIKELEKSLDLTKLPSNNLVIDIGFGTGESTIALSKMFANDIVYGIECYKPGVKKLMDNNIHVKWTSKVNELLAIIGYDPEYGARPIKREIRNTIEDKISELIITNEVKDGETLFIDVVDNKIDIIVEKLI